MTRLNFTNFAPEAQLQNDVTASATQITLDTVAGFPVPPFTIIVDADTGSEEIMQVTGTEGSATTYAVVRGISDTGGSGGPAFSHSAGASVKHGATAQDFNNMAKVYEAMDDGAGGVNPPIGKPEGGITWGDLV